ncbi:MAG TPA: hypothetical protein VHV55_05325, partial [Pirellulales bacterium]|nr:hypothetical protein [Pirellulales bacterium]
MRWTPWNCAPSPKKSRLAAFRALQAELLEPRLALSHAPPTDYGADPGHDAGSQNAPAYSSSAYGAS